MVGRSSALSHNNASVVIAVPNNSRTDKAGLPDRSGMAFGKFCSPKIGKLIFEAIFSSIKRNNNLKFQIADPD